MSEIFDEYFNSDVEEETKAETVTEEASAQAAEEQTATTDQAEAQDETTPETKVDPAPQAEDAGVEEVAEKKDKRDHPIPLPTFLDMRDRAKAAEAKERERAEEAAQLRRELEAFRNPQVDQVHDLSDPSYFLTEVERRVQDALYQDRANRSAAVAESKYGEEAVVAAVEWAASRNDPAFRIQITQQADPAEWVYQQHKAATAFENFQRDPDEYVRQRAKELGLFQQATAPVAAAPQQQRAEKSIPKSITEIPASGATRATNRTDLEEEYKGAFNP